MPLNVKEDLLLVKSLQRCKLGKYDSLKPM